MFFNPPVKEVIAFFFFIDADLEDIQRDIEKLDQRYELISALIETIGCGISESIERAANAFI